MSNGSEIGGLLGAGIGFFASGFNPVGAQWGFMIGSAVGSYISPTKINGPKLGDGQRQTSTDGQPIAWIMGTAPIVGTIVQASQYRDIKVKDSGKGAPKVTHQERLQDFAILICESCSLRDSMMANCIMVTQDGKIVYDVRPDSTMLDASAKWKENVTFQFGAEDQLPNPTMEMDTGVGNTASYRGVATAIFSDFNITQAGGRIPTFQFVMAEETAGQDMHYGEVAHTGSPIAPPYPDNAFISVVSQAINYDTTEIPNEVTLAQYLASVGGSNFYGRPTRYMLRNGDNGSILYDSGWICGDVEYAQLLTYYDNPDLPGPRPTVDTTRLLPLPPVTMMDFVINEAGAVTPYPVRVLGNLNIGAGNNNLYYDTYIYARLQTGPVFANMVLMKLAGSANATTPVQRTLSNIVTRVCKRGGLRDDQIDADSLSSIMVEGFPIARPCTGVEALTPLLQTYFAYGSEYDSQIHFFPRGADAVMTIDENDLIAAADANDGAVTSALRNMETQFPRKMIGSYIDPAQNYTTVTVSDERAAIDVKAIGTQNFDMPVVMQGIDALAATIKAMKVKYADLEGTLTYSLPYASKSNVYLRLVSGDAVIFLGKRWEIVNIKMSIDRITLTTTYSRQSAFTADVETIDPGKAPSVPASPYGAPVTLVPFNSPSLRPQDTTGIYLGAAASTVPADWRGCVVQVSYDDQVSWTNGPTIGTASVLGKVTAADPLTVKMSDDLLSVTEAQLSANANAFALIHASGTELGQVGTAMEVEGTPYAYVLSRLIRGGLGTAQAPATVGESIVMLEDVYFLPIDPSFAGRTIYLRAIAPGETAEDATVVSIVYNPIGQPELSIRVDEDDNIRVDEYGNQRVTN